MRVPLLAGLTAFCALVSADVQFITPAAGVTAPGGGSITITWKDSGVAPAISQLSGYQLFLCAGSNDPAGYVSCFLLSFFESLEMGGDGRWEELVWVDSGVDG